jgi:hypothetical protein
VIKQAWIAPDGAGCYHFCYHIPFHGRQAPSSNAGGHLDDWFDLMGKKAEIWTAEIKAASLGGRKFHEDVP